MGGAYLARGRRLLALPPAGRRGRAARLAPLAHMPEGKGEQLGPSFKI